MKNKWMLGLTIVLLGSSVQASEQVELSWGDLIPKQAQYDDPFLELNAKQLYELSLVANYQQRSQSGETLTDESQALFDEVQSSLREQGIDSKALLQQRARIAEKRKMASQSLKLSLNNNKVRMPGYLLPLEYKNTAITEFLLVPSVGACIHIPPPPPNQMVFVKYDEGIEVTNLYTPVWVEGQMTVGQGQSELYLTDGSDQVTFGYRINAKGIEEYSD